MRRIGPVHRQNICAQAENSIKDYSDVKNVWVVAIENYLFAVKKIKLGVVQWLLKQILVSEY
jgi:hypothetical protein